MEDREKLILLMEWTDNAIVISEKSHTHFGDAVYYKDGEEYRVFKLGGDEYTLTTITIQLATSSENFNSVDIDKFVRGWKRTISECQIEFFEKELGGPK